MIKKWHNAVGGGGDRDEDCRGTNPASTGRVYMGCDGVRGWPCRDSGCNRFCPEGWKSRAHVTQAPTNEIVNLLEAVCDWITDRVTGAVIYGRPRLGKTKMIEFMVKNIPIIHEVDSPIFHIVSLHPKIAKEEAISRHQEIQKQRSIQTSFCYR